MSATKLGEKQKYNEKTMFQVLGENYAETTQVQRTGMAPGQDQEQVQRPAVQVKKYSSLSKDEKKAEEAKYKTVKAANTYVSEAQLNTPYMQKVLSKESKIGGRKMTQKQLFDMVVSGDCSHMQRLDSVLRNRAATIYLQQHKDLFTLTPEQFMNTLKAKENPVSEMMNPLMRMAISLVINSPDAADEVKTKYRKLDELLNTEIMVATITKKAVADPANGISESDVKRNTRSQIFMVKSLLSCHLGKFKIVNNGTPSAWPGNVANAFTHCSRVAYTMPGQDLSQGKTYSEDDEKLMLRSFAEEKLFYGRMCATHALNRKRRDGSADAKEQKVVMPFKQYGLNVAVGGLGNAGIPAGQTKRLLKNDGSCGHIFMHLEKGNETKHTGMLIGFESDSFGTMNQTGHVHDVFATGEFASSFGGQRCDEIGDKYGGRVADLSELNIQHYARAMQVVDAAMQRLLKSNDPADAQILDKLARDVSGTLMDDTKLTTFFTTVFNIMGAGTDSEHQAKYLVNSLGGGHSID